jgi:EAL domain-containing protein (putative c-di-GMP-specific phosphodiesterase class I)
VAEGIETEDDYRTVQELGVKLHQGYHLGRPLATPVRDHPLPAPTRPVQQEFKLSRYLGSFRRYSELKS